MRIVATSAECSLHNTDWIQRIASKGLISGKPPSLFTQNMRVD